MTHGKRTEAARKLVEKSKLYNVEDAEIGRAHV